MTSSRLPSPDSQQDAAAFDRGLSDAARVLLLGVVFAVMYGVLWGLIWASSVLSDHGWTAWGFVVALLALMWWIVLIVGVLASIIILARELLRSWRRRG